MEESCYLCRRTRLDLERLNEEIRTRVYLSYFSNARAQIDDQRRKIGFLQRLKDEEGGDPHFRINAKQVFGDPAAYKKLMPWIETLMEIAAARAKPVDERRTMGELVEQLLAEEHGAVSKLEEGLNQIRSGFATGGRSPFTLDTVTFSFPVEWSIPGGVFAWHRGPATDAEPLHQSGVPPTTTVEVPVHLCTVCQWLAGSSARFGAEQAPTAATASARNPKLA